MVSISISIYFLFVVLVSHRCCMYCNAKTRSTLSVSLLPHVYIARNLICNISTLHTGYTLCKLHTNSESRKIFPRAKRNRSWTKHLHVTKSYKNQPLSVIEILAKHGIITYKSLMKWINRAINFNIKSYLQIPHFSQW